MSAHQRVNVAPNPSNADEGAYFLAGMLMLWGGATAPDDWLLCNGTAVSRSTYADLFEVIGTTFGAGDGSAVPIFSGAVGGGAGLGYQVNFVSNPYIVEGNTFIINGTGTTLDGGTYTAIAPTNSTVITFIHGKTPAPGLINAPGSGTVTKLGTLTTFTLPATNGRTVRGVGTSSWTGLNSGTAGTTAVTLGQTAGADGTKQLADNLPQHRHGVFVPGGNTLSAGSGLRAGTANVDDGTLTIANTTKLDAANTLVTNSNTLTTNAYIGINYIIKT